MEYKFTIYQLGPNSDRFKRFEDLPEGTETVDLEKDKYISVYTGRLDGISVMSALENIFFIFNMQHPKDFRGHSISVSDIVKLNGTYYFCGGMGWDKINVINDSLNITQ